ncbi:MAG: septum formation inhibitor Maf [Gammaproteobacteria bacterium]|nr:septum formation inhibitor Maf [Gammaproteobacteria bacterium]
MVTEKRPVVLASSSPYRRELLDRLGLDYSTVSPDIDESVLPGETPAALVERLAEQKARAVGATHPGLIIGSDQVATIENDILGKPGSHDSAVAQLTRLSGRQVTFQTGLCLLDTTHHELQVDVVPFTVQFRSLSAGQIERYLRTEQPYNCAGSFKSEGLGIALFEKMLGEDPTALIGLPLIRLTTMLENAQIQLP